MEPIKGLRVRNSAAGGATTASITSTSHQCGGCGQMIKDRYLLQALDVYWHEDCLKCGCCDCRLGEVGSTLYTRANLILCKRDYLRLFGATGSCAACCKVIPAFEMVMRAKNNVYHLECFACSCCQQRFCVGDRFYLCDNRILCQYDYEERIIFANLAPPNGATPQPMAGPSETANSATGTQRPNRAQWSRNPTTSSRSGETLPAGASGAGSASAAGGPLTAQKQDSPTGGDASSSGYGSPDSGLIDEG